jgi:Asp-tRNA(Asn)/Glu-tRNA(Gln) amidotransferase A subunit family amidase
LVSILKRMGAVIIAKSNLPQSIMVSYASEACEFM